MEERNFLAHHGRRLQIAIDIIVLSCAFWASWFLRFDGLPPYMMLKRLALTWPYVVFLQYMVLVAFGAPRLAWRYVGLPEARTLAYALCTSAFLLSVVRVVAARLMAIVGHAQFLVIPFGVIAGDLSLAFLLLVGVRVVRRLLGERVRRQVRFRHKAVPTMLIGAGDGGVAVVKELWQRPDAGILPIGFLDDNQALVGTVIHGVPVLGTTGSLVEMCAHKGAKQVLVTIASATGADVRRIVSACEEIAMPVKIIPRLHEIVSGTLEVTRFRDVAIEDLLGRAEVVLDVQSVAAFIQGKTVLVTGGGGSIGSELCRQVVRFGPKCLVIVERFETALFEIEQELLTQRKHLDVAVVPVLADVVQEESMRTVFETHRPMVVFHAAAHKHVPLVEQWPAEAAKNNIGGTMVIGALADEFEAKAFVLVSTDKAVNPTSVMGATKRVAELYTQGMASRSSTVFAAVRFGNVLGSNGSVVPIFKRQIQEGGPITVTHPEMRRYFMTIPEAAQLVLQAGSMGRGGEVFILDMGSPVRIVDLARDLIRLSGLEPGQDIDIVFSGIRPGEKLFEELATTGENAEATRHDKIFIGKVQGADWEALISQIEELKDAPIQDIRARLKAIVPEFQC